MIRECDSKGIWQVLIGHIELKDAGDPNLPTAHPPVKTVVNWDRWPGTGHLSLVRRLLLAL
jgi:hypothetical protein